MKLIDAGANVNTPHVNKEKGTKIYPIMYAAG